MRKSITISNIINRPLRSITLLILSAFLAFSIVSLTLVLRSLQSGFESLEARLGADIMVVPYEAATKSDLENIVLQGNTGYFYMNGEIYDEIADIEGVESVTAQYFLASASSSCCSIPVQIIGYEPESDFVITPWIKKSNGSTPDYLDVVVGNDLNAFVGDTLTFYGTDVKVAAKLDKTGTSYDTAVFCTRDTIRTLIEASLDKKLNSYANINAGNVVSCVLINVDDEHDVEEVLNYINIHYKKVKAVRTKNMIASVGDGLSGVSGVMKVIAILVWIVALIIMAVAFMMNTGERKKEFAILRIMGASRKKMSAIVFKEGIILAFAGSVLGVIAGFTMVVPFSGFIEQSLGLPFLLPKLSILILAALISVAASVLTAAITAGAAAYRIGRIDAGEAIRSGE